MPHIGEIIKSLRKAKGLSQDDLAQAAFSNRTTISLIELGKQDYSDAQLLSIKNALGVEGLPLLESERSPFREMLYKWYNMISERNWDAAKEMRSKLSIIQQLPHDKELFSLFALFNCRLLLGLHKVLEAKKILDLFDANLDELSDKTILFHYHFNKGTYNLRKKRTEEALKFYLKAFELMNCGLEKNIYLYYNIAICYEEIGLIAMSITYLEEACVLFTGNQNTVSQFSLYIFLGANYARLSSLQRAKMLLDKAHAIVLHEQTTSDTEDSKKRLGMVYNDYSFMFRMAKKWIRAVEYADKALGCLEKGTELWLEALYQKIRSLIEINNVHSYTDILEEGIYLAKDDEVYNVLFGALKSMAISSDESIEFIEVKVLPYLLKMRILHPALDYCEFLRDYYKSKYRTSQAKVFKVTETICNITSEMLKGGVIE